MMDLPGLTAARQLGEGGTALVARAYSPEFKKQIAIKYPLNDDNATINEFKRLATRESELIGRLRFPGIVRLLRFSKDPPSLQLELCEGQTLDKIERIDDVSGLLNVVSAIAAELEFLRLKKLLHCDLKPQNLFLPADPRVINSGRIFFIKITDFSFGRRFDESESARIGHGTVGYAAPETMAQRKTSHRADLFSLGVIAYRLATGHHPFIVNESDPVIIESNVCEKDPEPLSSYRKDLPPEFVSLIQQLLSKDEKDRPETGWEVCRALRSAGCLYPYEKVISPAYLLGNVIGFEGAMENFLEVNPRQRERLITLTGSVISELRLLLTANFLRKNLKYTGDRFRFASEIYWPSQLRRRALHCFSKATLSDRKQIVRAAIVGSCEEAGRIGVFDITDRSRVLPGIFPLVQQFLSQSFVTRLSADYARLSEEKHELHAATRLYTQAGKLDDAVRCVNEAVKNPADAEQRTRAILLIGRVLDFAQLLGKQFQVRQLLMVKGDLLKASGLSDRAMETYNQILELYKNREPDKLLAETYRDQSDLYKTRQNFTAGIDVLQKAMLIYQQLGDDLGKARSLNNLGNLYWVNSDLPNALRNYRAALMIQKNLGAEADAAKSLSNIGSIFGMMGRLHRTIRVLNISLKMMRKVGDKEEIARTLNNLGYACQLSGNLTAAVECLSESLEINRKTGNKKEILFNLWNLTETKVKCGQFPSAISHAVEGLDLSEAMNDKPHLGRFFLSMAKIKLHKGLFSEANEYLEKSQLSSIVIDDEVLDTNILIQRAELRLQIGDYEHAANLAKDALDNARRIKASSEVLESLLILIKTTGSEEHVKAARQLIDRPAFSRERILLKFANLQYLLEQKTKPDLGEVAECCKPDEHLTDADIELPKLLNIRAEALLTMSREDDARQLLQRALQIATSKEMLREQITALILMGKISMNSSRYEDAYSSFRQALRLSKEVVDNIDNKKDRDIYINSKKMSFLSGEIKRLNEKLLPKKKAGA